MSDDVQDKLENDPRTKKSEIIFGYGFDGVTDIEVGPDGYLYVLFVWQVEIRRIAPDSDNTDLPESN